jgi:hypothetical protein
LTHQTKVAVNNKKHKIHINDEIALQHSKQVAQRLGSKAEAHWGQDPFGFRRDCGTLESIATLQALLREKSETQQQGSCVFYGLQESL